MNLSEYSENVIAFFKLNLPYRPEIAPTWEFSSLFPGWVEDCQPPMGPSD